MTTVNVEDEALHGKKMQTLKSEVCLLLLCEKLYSAYKNVISRS